jgi:CheY-like chemotaxis protein/anti-sigma regulatory factor (Ser/Thr protein kinase)
MTKSSKKYVSFMGHELKAPLAAIQSSLEVDDGKNVRLNLELYKKTISRLLELIDDILDQAKSSEGSMKLHIASFNPAEEAAFLLEPFAIQARRKGLGFSSDIGPELYRPAWGDPLRFRQVIANLVSNAIKYTSAGKIHVRLQGTTAEDGLNITGIIEDTGKGIEAERLEMIWKPFVSAEGVLEDGQSSHGLGLSIVRNVIDSMGGTISVSSTPGQGSNFTFTIPLQAMPPEIPLGKISPISADNHDTNHPQDNKNTGTPDLQGLRVLVADDEKISRLTWNHVFKGWGAQVFEAAGGDQALRLAKSDAYDIIVLDMHMPVMNGLEVLAGLRDFETRAERKPAFIILSSGEAINPPETVDAVLPKPFNREQLKKVLMSRFQGP